MICTKLWTLGTFFFLFLCVCVMVFVFVWMIFLCVWFSLPFGKPTKRNGRRRARWMLCSLCHLMLAKCFSIYMNPGVLVVCNPYCGFNVTATLHSIICIFQLLGKKKNIFLFSQPGDNDDLSYRVPGGICLYIWARQALKETVCHAC